MSYLRKVITTVVMCSLLAVSVLTSLASLPDAIANESYVFLQNFDSAAVGQAVNGDGITSDEGYGAAPASAKYEIRSGSDKWLTVSEASRFHYWTRFTSTTTGAGSYITFYIEAVTTANTRIVVNAKNANYVELRTTEAYSYKLMTDDGVITELNTGWAMEISAGFSGWVLIPTAAFKGSEALEGILSFGITFESFPAGSSYAVDNIGIVKNLAGFCTAFGAEPVVSSPVSSTPEAGSSDYKLWENFNSKTVGPVSDSFGGLPTQNSRYSQRKAGDNWLQIGENSQSNSHFAIRGTDMSFGPDDYIGIYIDAHAANSASLRFFINDWDHYTNSSFEYKTYTKVKGMGSGEGWQANLGKEFAGFLFIPHSAFSDSEDSKGAVTSLSVLDLNFTSGTSAEMSFDNIYIISDLDKFIDEIAPGEEYPLGDSGAPAEPERGAGNHIVWENFNAKTKGEATSSWWGNSIPGAKYGEYLGSDLWLQFVGGENNIHFGIEKEGMEFSFKQGDYVSFYLETSKNLSSLLRIWANDGSKDVQLKEVMSYKLLPKGGTLTDVYDTWGISLEKGFKGWVFIPWDSFAAVSPALDRLAVFDLNLHGSDRNGNYGFDDLSIVYDLNAFIANGIVQKPPRSDDDAPPPPEYGKIDVPYTVWEDFENKEIGEAENSWKGIKLPNAQYEKDHSGSTILTFNGGEANSHFIVDKNDSPIIFRPRDYIAFYFDSDTAIESKLQLYLNDGINSGMKSDGYTYYTLTTDGMLQEHPQAQMMTFSSGFSGYVIVPSNAFNNSPFGDLLEFDINFWVSYSDAKYKLDNLTIIYNLDVFLKDISNEWGIIPPPEDIEIVRPSSDTSLILKSTFESLYITGSRLNIKITDDYNLFSWMFEGVDVNMPLDFDPLVKKDFSEASQIRSLLAGQDDGYLIKTDTLPGWAVLNLYLEDACYEPYLYRYDNGKMIRVSYNPYTTDQGYTEVFLKQGGIYYFSDQLLLGAFVDNGNWDAPPEEDDENNYGTGDYLRIEYFAAAMLMCAAVTAVFYRKRKESKNYE